jgi:TRAP-type C4-dicarboxylate transport system permease small subunit
MKFDYTTTNTHSNKTPKSFLEWIDRVYSHIEGVFGNFSAITVLLMMFAGSAQVILRTGFNYPIPGYVDVIMLGLVVISFGGLSACQRVGGHVRMDLVIGKFSGRTFWIIELVSTLLAFAFVAIMANAAYGYFLRSYTLGDSTMDIEIILWPTKLFVAVALFMLGLRLLIGALGFIRMIINPDARPVAIPALLSIEDRALEEIQESAPNDKKDHANGNRT